MSKIFCILNVDLQGEEFLRICTVRKEFVRNWCRIFSTPILAVEIFLSKFIQSKKLHHALSKKFCRAKNPVSKKFCRNSGVLPSNLVAGSTENAFLADGGKTQEMGLHVRGHHTNKVLKGPLPSFRAS